MFGNEDNFIEAWDDLLFGRGDEDESYESLQGLAVKPSTRKLAQKEDLYESPMTRNNVNEY